MPSSKAERLHFTWENLTIACSECNRRKNDYHEHGMEFLDPYMEDVEAVVEHHGPIMGWISGNTRAEITIKILELHNAERFELILRKIEKIDVSYDTLNLIRAGLKKVVNDPRGTGMKARLKDIVIAGKTGTAENPMGKAHGWFSGFAPFDNPKICVMAFVEFGGKGGLEASILARKVIEKSRELGIW